MNVPSVVGLDPAPARRAVHLLEQAESELQGAARRTQLMLATAGLTSSLPGVIRGVGRTCGGIATDLGRRRTVVYSRAGGSNHLPGWIRAGDLAPRCGPMALVLGVAGTVVTTTTTGPAGCAPGGGSYSFSVEQIAGAQSRTSTSRKQRWWTEQELQGASETLTEAEKQAIRDKQAGRDYQRQLYASARRKLIKSEKIKGTRNAGKERGQPSRR